MNRAPLIFILTNLCLAFGYSGNGQGTWDTLSHNVAGSERQTPILLDDGTVHIPSNYYYSYVFDPILDSVFDCRSHGGVESVMVKLNDGNLFASGGSSSTGKHFGTTWLVSFYNPLDKTRLVSNLSHTSKSNHTGTLLNDDRVLIAGGVRDVGVIAIINDPYVADTAWFNGKRPEVFKVHDSCFVFNPLDTSLVPTSNLKTARARHKAVKLDNGKVFIIGGRDKDSRLLKTCEIFDPVAETWTYTDSLPLGLSRFKIVKLPGGDILLSGGFGKWGASSLCFRFNPSTQKWQNISGMKVKRYNHTMTLLRSGKVLVTGGANDEVLKSAEIYDPINDTWNLVPDMHFYREEHAALAIPSGEILIVGGINDQGEIRQLEIFRE